MQKPGLFRIPALPHILFWYIFCFQVILLAVSVYPAFFPAADRATFIYDSGADFFRVMVDFQVFQPVAAVKDSFPNLPHALGNGYTFQSIALEECLVS